jgi:hypothetical protein
MCFKILGKNVVPNSLNYIVVFKSNVKNDGRVLYLELIRIRYFSKFGFWLKIEVHLSYSYQSRGLILNLIGSKESYYACCRLMQEVVGPWTFLYCWPVHSSTLFGMII